MTIGLAEFTKDFTPEEREGVAARTAALIKEELLLRELRQTQHLTQGEDRIRRSTVEGKGTKIQST